MKDTNCCDHLKKVPELLAPAGGTEALIAAVQNGADAVYLGLSFFNARAAAENFTLDSLPKWLDYAHLRGVRVHITINTLLKDTELDEAAELALTADKMGADAFIVQDIGLASRLRGKIKAKMHASTQMTVYNTEGLRTLQELGFSRAVLARELSLGEIKRLSRAGIMETEVFCHGALCISYSGQCMLSRFTCGRSGNRGTCSQPCRLKYASVNDSLFENLMSPADLCSLSYINELASTGVSSLKIEGRLKSPEYTAAVTAAYRKALDDTEAVTQKDIDDLTVIFSRGGFSSGHQLGKMPLSSITRSNSGRTGLEAGKLIGAPPRKINGPVDIYEINAVSSRKLVKGDGITFYNTQNIGNKAGGVINIIEIHGKRTETLEPGIPAKLTVAGEMPKITFNKKHPSNINTDGPVFFKTLDSELYTKLRESFKPGIENKKVPLRAHFILKTGRRAELSLTDDDGRTVTAISDVLPEPSEKRALQLKDAEEKLAAAGGTPFIINQFTCDIDDGIFISFTELKKLRRKAIDLITEKRTEVPAR